jgi:hypothetical protein
MMNSDDDQDASGADIIALYESLNPAKRNLLPLEYQAILRSKGYDIGGGGKQLPALSKTGGRPPTSHKRDATSPSYSISMKN